MKGQYYKYFTQSIDINRINFVFLPYTRNQNDDSVSLVTLRPKGRLGDEGVSKDSEGVVITRLNKVY